MPKVWEAPYHISKNFPEGYVMSDIAENYAKRIMNGSRVYCIAHHKKN